MAKLNLFENVESFTRVFRAVMKGNEIDSHKTVETPLFM